MKNKKILSFVISLAMLMNLSLIVKAETVASRTVNFSEVNVTSDGKGITGNVNGLTVGRDSTSADYSPVYKVNGVFGLSDSEYGIKIAALDNKAAGPYIKLTDSNEYDLDTDFYIQTVQYISEVSDVEGNRVKVGGLYYDGSTKVKRNPYFQGTGDVTSETRLKRRGTSWDENNWHTITLAYTASTHMLATYIDDWHMVNSFSGTRYEDKEVTTSIKNLEIGATIEVSDTEIETCVIMSTARLVVGTFDPASTVTNVTSDKYTVTKGSAYSYSTPDLTTAVISGIPFNYVTAEEFIGDINLPAGATAQVVRIADGTDKTTVVAGGEIVTDGMKLLVRAENGVSLKLFDLVLDADPNLYPRVEFSNEGYSAKNSLGESALTVMPHTSIETALSMFTTPNETQIEVVDADGLRMYDGEITADMKLRCTKGENIRLYDIKIADTLVKVSGEDDYLGSLLLRGTVSANALSWDVDVGQDGASGLKSLSGWNTSPSVGYSNYNTSGGQWSKPDNAPDGTYMATGEVFPGTDDPAFKLESQYVTADGAAEPWWIVHTMEQTLAGAGAAATGQVDSKKMIYSFKARVEEGGSLMLLPGLAYSRASQNKGPGMVTLNRVSGNTQEVRDNYNYGASLWLNGGVITLGGDSLASRGYYATVGNYTEGTNIDVTVAMKTPQNETSLEIEGIYLGGRKIFPPEGRHCISVYSQPLMGIREFQLATRGTVYFGDFKFYTADEYCTTPALADTDAVIQSLGDYSKAEENDTATISRTIKVYNRKEASAALVAVSYDGNGKLIDMDIDERVLSGEETEFSVTIHKNAVNKIFLWDSTLSMKPYIDGVNLEEILILVELIDLINGQKAENYGAVDASLFE